MTDQQMLDALSAHWTVPVLRHIDAPAHALTWLGLGVLGRLWSDYPACWVWNALCDVQCRYWARLMGCRGRRP